MHVVDLLVRQPSVVLQDVVVFGVGREGDFLEDGQNVEEGVVGDVSQLGTVMFGDDELWQDKMLAFPRSWMGVMFGVQSVAYSVAFTQRLNVEERKDLVVLE